MRTNGLPWVVATAVWCAAPAVAADWRFRVLLDGEAIGEHSFSVSTTGDERKVVSEADFVVRLLGVPVYRYRHSASESWRGNCLAQLVSFTDDDGKISRVRAQAGKDGRLDVTVGSTTRSLPACTMTFAYWNPALRQQTRLLNAQTGEEERVQIRPLGDSTLEVRGEPVAAQQWRISGPSAPLDLWYSAQGDWIGLDSAVAGGRKLSYRLK
ncbi:DUF6134 family protein [Variovorax sp. GT1P44]|uniref:DUF6134 family protein n=1 Tax=Variovorax sp. GT1P44 TaxID=3443742 RepID=UPI003F45DEEB